MKMYDSKSDHSRSRYSGHRSDWSRPGRVIRADERERVDLEEYLVADLDIPMPAKPVYTNQPVEEPLAEWERQLLYGYDYKAAERISWSSSQDEIDGAHSRDWDEDEDGDIGYYGDPAERVDVYCDSEGNEYYAGPLDDEDETSWLQCMTYSEAMQELGDGFTIEGPAFTSKHTVNVPLKAVNYMRLYELAREIGVDSKALITYMRLQGEYVANHMSMVADPVAERLHCQKEAIQEALGERTTPETSAQRWHLALEREAFNASRPGRNPFANYPLHLR